MICIEILKKPFFNISLTKNLGQNGEEFLSWFTKCFHKFPKDCCFCLKIMFWSIRKTQDWNSCAIQKFVKTCDEQHRK